ncbi:hypothetical protein AOQ84DRAFT_410776 [Glonium stellatum]|uniref:C2H2-type domain-containing protein n=1 Tax=Glonium stellatum TaxID=574774 RepID=A0A8E2FB61_9PEZI|nr:hypothetical protein AOQ84DRAFT_410776 [Glonium stellatum]
MEPQSLNQSSHISSSRSWNSLEFSCSLCGDTFKRLEHLSRHKLSHTEERPYSCPMCNKGFTRKYVFYALRYAVSISTHANRIYSLPEIHSAAIYPFMPLTLVGE